MFDCATFPTKLSLQLSPLMFLPLSSFVLFVRFVVLPFLPCPLPFFVPFVCFVVHLI